MREVEKFCKSNALNFYYDSTMFDFIIERYNNDPEFKERQKVLGKMAIFANSLGLLNLAKIKYFHKYHPYMKLEIKRV